MEPRGYFVRFAVTLFLGIGCAGCGVANQLQLQSEVSQQKDQIARIKADCIAKLQNPILNPIRSKVVLYNDPPDASPPVSILSNTTFAAPDDDAALHAWAQIRDDCLTAGLKAAQPPTAANAAQRMVLEQDNSFFTEAHNLSNQMLVALMQHKITYGEFAEENYKIVRDAFAAERQFRAAVVAADQQRQMQEQQQFQNALLAYATVVNQMQARQPRVETANCSGMGNSISCVGSSQ